MTEQVEIVRVKMVVVAKTITGLTRACPAILDPREPALVERNGAGRFVTLPNHSLVLPHQENERGDRRQDDPDAQNLLPCGNEHNSAKRKDRQPGVTELSIAARQLLMGDTSLVEPDAVGLRGVGMHA